MNKSQTMVNKTACKVICKTILRVKKMQRPPGMNCTVQQKPEGVFDLKDNYIYTVVPTKGIFQ